MSLFGPSFMHANMGSRRGLMAPAPIIQMGSGLRIGTVDFPHASILAGTAVTIVQGVPGSILIPLFVMSTKNISVIYAPTNTSFSVRYAGSAVVLTGLSITPQVVSLGGRYDFGDASAWAITPPGQLSAIGKALTILPSAVNGGGSAANRLQFSVGYVIVPAIAGS